MDAGKVINGLVRIGSIELYFKTVRACLLWGAATIAAGVVLCVSNGVESQILFGLVAGNWVFGTRGAP